MIYSTSFKARTKGFTDIIDITGSVTSAIADSNLSDGIVTLFVPGSTAGITTIEYESGVVADLKGAIDRLAPRDIPYEHDSRWGDGNGFSHVRAALLGASLTIPFQSGVLKLGTWQQIVLVDFDNRSRDREVTAQIMGE